MSAVDLCERLANTKGILGAMVKMEGEVLSWRSSSTRLVGLMESAANVGAVSGNCEVIVPERENLLRIVVQWCGEIAVVAVHRVGDPVAKSVRRSIRRGFSLLDDLSADEDCGIEVEHEH